MKKLVSLIMVLALVLGLATVALADSATVLTPVYNEDNGTWECVYNDPEATYSVTLPDGCNEVVIVWPFPGGPHAGAQVTIASPGNNDYSVAYGMMPIMSDMGGYASFEISPMWGYTFSIQGQAGDTYTISFAMPSPGTANTPVELYTLEYAEYNVDGLITQAVCGEGNVTFTVAPPAEDPYQGYYHYNFYTEGDVFIHISDVQVSIPEGQAVDGATVDWSIALGTNYGYASLSAMEADVTEATVGSACYESSTMVVSAAQYKDVGGFPTAVGPATITFKLTFEHAGVGSALKPIYKECVELPETFQTISVPASEVVEDNYYGLNYVYYNLYNYYDMGGQLVINDASAVVKYNGECYTAANDHDDNDAVLTVNMAYDTDYFAVGIANIGEATKRYMVSLDLIEGYFQRPAALDLGQNSISFGPYDVYNCMYDYGYYFLEWTAAEDGVLTLSDLKAVLPEEYETYYDSEAEIKAKYELYLNMATATEDPFVEGDSVEVKKGDVVTVRVYVEHDADIDAYYPADVTFDAGFMPANPIEINNATALSGIELGAGETKYYAINGKLNGQILTINGDANTVVTLNGKELTAVNGVFTAELTGTPVNALIVTNKGAEAASYTAGIGFALGTAGNPISVTTEQGVGGKIDAGAEVHYLLNSKLSGAVLSVQGEGAYVIVDGVKTEAKDGVIKLTLNAKNPTISLVIGNTGSAAASVVLAFSDNPPTGDLSILAPAAALLVSAMSTVALVIKKKEF